MRYGLIAVLLLAGCKDPSVHTDVRIGPDGVRVSPTVKGGVGDVDVTVRG